MSLFAPPSAYDDDLFDLASSDDDFGTPDDDDKDAQMSRTGSSNQAEFLARSVGASNQERREDVAQVSTAQANNRKALQEARKMHLCFQPPIRSVMTKSKLQSMTAAFFDEDHNKYILPPSNDPAQWINDIRDGSTDPLSTVVVYVQIPENIPMLMQPHHPSMTKRTVEPRAPDVDPHRWVSFSNTTTQFKGRITSVNITGRSSTGYVVIESFQHM